MSLGDIQGPTSTVPVIDARQFKLMSAIVIATLMAFALTIIDLATGGRPDPPRLRAAATLLDGPWRFHTGDDPRWANPVFDDAGWETIDMTPPPGSHDGDVGRPDYLDGWAAHGHPDYHGYAWYRRAVTVPAAPTSWDILGPSLVEDGYELYWNGERLGGSGRLGSHPRVVGTRPMRFVLPVDAAGTRGVIAIRSYMLQRSGPSERSGGMHSPPILAPHPVGAALHRAQWRRTIAGYIVDVIEPAGMVAVIGLAIGGWSRSRHKGFLAFACIALALTATRRLNNAIASWTDLQALTTYSMLASVLWQPTIATWMLAWNRWCGRAWRSIDALAIALALLGLGGTLAHLQVCISSSRYGSILLSAVIAARILRTRTLRGLAMATLALLVLGLFGGELLDPLGVPGIWFPFGIGVSRTQYVYALSTPLLAFLIVLALAQGAQRHADPAGKV